jgi:hypothetical protein
MRGKKPTSRNCASLSLLLVVWEMGFDFKSFRRLDAYADNEVDEKSRSAIGGVLSLLW